MVSIGWRVTEFNRLVFGQANKPDCQDWWWGKESYILFTLDKLEYLLNQII